MIPDTLISFEYLGEQVRLHKSPRGYGQRGGKWAPMAAGVARAHGAMSVLDYGCGQGMLALALRCAPLGLEVQEYDPAVIGKDILPTPVDMVICTDVLEHIEPDKIDNVLDHITSLAGRVFFVVISLVETAKTLSTGEQAHILLKPVEWWREAIQRRGWQIVEEPEIKPEKQWVAVCVRPTP